MHLLDVAVPVQQLRLLAMSHELPFAKVAGDDGGGCFLSGGGGGVKGVSSCL